VIRNLRFSNILANGEAGILIYGSRKALFRNVQFDRVKLKVKPADDAKICGRQLRLRGDVTPELSYSNMIFRASIVVTWTD